MFINLLALPVAAATLFQVKIWVETTDTQIRTKSVLYENTKKCEQALDEYILLLDDKGYEAISRDKGNYKGYVHINYLAKMKKNNAMISCTTLP
jgi:hypothetical protein